MTASTSAINGNDDVIAFLTNQHEQIKALFTRVKDAIGQDREDAFLELRRLLAVHETAEEEIETRAPGERPQAVDDAVEEEQQLEEIGVHLRLPRLGSMGLQSLEMPAQPVDAVEGLHSVEPGIEGADHLLDALP